MRVAAIATPPAYDSDEKLKRKNNAIKCLDIKCRLTSNDRFIY